MLTILPCLGQRCAGRNYSGRRCCTPEQPCGEGEGDCDGPGDGGQHDGHAGCQGDLVCGSNNCKQFGHYYHEKDDCCERPANISVPEAPPVNPFINSIHPTFFRPIGKRNMLLHLNWRTGKISFERKQNQPKLLRWKAIRVMATNCSKHSIQLEPAVSFGRVCQWK